MVTRKVEMDVVSTLSAARFCFNSPTSVAHAAVPVKIVGVPLSIGFNTSAGVVETAEEDDEENYDGDGRIENQMVVADTKNKWRTSINRHSEGGFIYFVYYFIGLQFRFVLFPILGVWWFPNC